MEGISALQEYIRQVMSTALAACHGDLILARTLFLNKIVGAMCDHLPQLRGDVWLRAEVLRHLSDAIVPDGSTDWCEGLGLLPDPPECLLRDSRLVGWAYQIWNEPERKGNSWAVSRRSNRQNETANIELITQLFTDDYIADFLARCCLHSVGRACDREYTNLTVCDPACGGGHLLIAIVRRLVECGQSLEGIGGRLWGFDIDPHVLAVARVAVFIEIVRCGYQGQREALWESLQQSIRLSPAPFGILDREVNLQGVPAQFDIVIANPPYLGRRKLSLLLREFLDQHYPAASIDLCAAFIQRCIELTKNDGSVGLLTTDKWLRLSGYSSLRDGGAEFPGVLGAVSLDLIVDLGERAFHPLAALHDGVKAAIFCGRKRRAQSAHTFIFGSLSQRGSYEDKVRLLRDFEAALGSSGLAGVSVSQARLKTEGAGAVMLAASGAPTTLLSSAKTVRDHAQVIVGTQTSNDREFVRYVWQVPPSASGWRVHSKGGGYARWAGLNRWVINWGQGAPFFFRTDQARQRAESWNDQKGWSYTWFANGNLGVRVKESGWSFGRAAASGIFTDDDRIAGYLNSRFASFASRFIGGKAQLPEGVVRKVPTPVVLDSISSDLVECAVGLKKEILRADISDVLFDPTASYSVCELFEMEALLLCVEGLLEAQVERALGLTQADSVAFSALAGAPVAWFATEKDDLAHSLWRALPPELQRYRDCVRSATSEVAGRYVVTGAPGESVGDSVLDALKAGPKRRYVLAAVGTVEQLSRATALHPCELVSVLRTGLEEDLDLRRWALVPWISNQILREILELLGHQWRSVNHIEPQSVVDRLSFDDMCDMVGSFLDRYEARELLDRPVPTWIEKVFIPWQARLFCGCSPLVVECNTKGTMELRHQWHEPGRFVERDSGEDVVAAVV